MIQYEEDRNVATKEREGYAMADLPAEEGELTEHLQVRLLTCGIPQGVEQSVEDILMAEDMIAMSSESEERDDGPVEEGE